tara:strand:- start:6963 stop:7601 length:639 start_codon:yes stop_codon:yes gene_type:complete
MANTTFKGTVRSEGGLKIISTDSTSGAETENLAIDSSSNIQSKGTLISAGTRKIQTFVGTLAGTNAASTAYADGDVLVELGTLDTTAPASIVTPTKFFIHRALVGITTAAGETLVGSLQLSATSGTATNSAVSSGTEIVGAGVTSFNEQLSATQSITEIDINFNDSAGNYHIFVPNITAAIASKNLYAAATTTVNADITAGRFTVELEYSVF